MRIAVIASEKVYKYLTENHPNIDWNKINNLSDLNGDFQYDLAINFDEDAGKLNYTNIQIPMLINSVCNTLKQFGHAENVIRFNGWETFLSRKAWEMSGKKDEKVEALFLLMGIKPIWLADEPGFVAARVLAMIINEAYFTKQENVSSEEEMNIALKLGTNYPKGPFEWANEIGLNNVFDLLKTLSLNDSRYKVCKLLEKEANKL